MSKISEKELQKKFYEVNHTRYEILVPNIHLCWKFNEMDIFCLRPSGFVDEIEIKLSASDFKADFRKKVSVEYNDFLPKHEALKKGLNHCNYFSFLIPEKIIDKCKIPDHAGLYVYTKYDNGRSEIREIKKAPRLHKRKLSEKLKYHAARKASIKYWYMAGAFKT